MRTILFRANRFNGVNVLQTAVIEPTRSRRLRRRVAEQLVAKRVRYLFDPESVEPDERSVRRRHTCDAADHLAGGS